jgi:hypothetical protein
MFLAFQLFAERFGYGVRERDPTQSRDFAGQAMSFRVLDA